jgi:hypothetical protein
MYKMENNTNTPNVNTRKYIYGHVSPETAYVVEDYPWGFRLRTTIRYWIESKKAKNGGQRFASQTINPKTGKWCAPKYSIYSQIMVMFLDENSHVKYTSLGMNDKPEWIEKFKETHLSHMCPFQMHQLRDVIAYSNVMQHVTFEFKAVRSEPVSLFSQDPIEIEKRKSLLAECEKNEQKEEEMFSKLNQAIQFERSKLDF